MNGQRESPLRNKRVAFCAAALAAGLLALPACAPAAPGPATATALPSGFLATPAVLGCLGLHLVPIATTDPLATSAISSEEAVSAAWQYEPSLKSATIIDTSLGQLANPPDGSRSISALAGSPLVWVVSFSGVQSVSSGPPGAEHHTADQYSVVIDAHSAQPLVAFPLCTMATP